MAKTTPGKKKSRKSISEVKSTKAGSSPELGTNQLCSSEIVESGSNSAVPEVSDDTRSTCLHENTIAPNEKELVLDKAFTILEVQNKSGSESQISFAVTMLLISLEEWESIDYRFLLAQCKALQGDGNDHDSRMEAWAREKLKKTKDYHIRKLLGFQRKERWLNDVVHKLGFLSQESSNIEGRKKSLCHDWPARGKLNKVLKEASKQVLGRSQYEVRLKNQYRPTFCSKLGYSRTKNWENSNILLEDLEYSAAIFEDRERAPEFLREFNQDSYYYFESKLKARRRLQKGDQLIASLTRTVDDLSHLGAIEKEMVFPERFEFRNQGADGKLFRSFMNKMQELIRKQEWAGCAEILEKNFCLKVEVQGGKSQVAEVMEYNDGLKIKYNIEALNGSGDGLYNIQIKYSGIFLKLPVTRFTMLVFTPMRVRRAELEVPEGVFEKMNYFLGARNRLELKPEPLYSRVTLLNKDQNAQTELYPGEGAIFYWPTQ